MSDKQTPSDPTDEPENQDSSAETGRVFSKRKQKHRPDPLPSDQDQNRPNQTASQTEDNDSVEDDLLADIRRSLVEEDSLKREKTDKGIFQRVTRLINPAANIEQERDRSQPEEVEEAPVFEDVQNFFDEIAALSSWEETASGSETTPMSGSDAERVDDADLPMDWDNTTFIPEFGETPVITEQSPTQLEEIKSRGAEVLKVDPNAEESNKRFEAIRDVALENYEDAPFLAEGEKQAISWRQGFKSFVRGLKPFERTLILGVISLIIIAGMLSLGFMVIKAQVANAPAVPAQDLPYPVRVTLPGGWAFNLVTGTVVDDKWSPTWAEWLQGTEICKWVALPWSLQLEAVVRSFKSGDVIELTMSNTDTLKFKVFSIENVPVDEISTLNRNTPSLLLILVNKDSETRWVVTAIP
ncbi:hypothetical protein [Candidatus Villigracilis saccharophilus]|uniref:hypothetical protein n=1 Tax=Candidatus Villigracilis saccharophilus TaxID=3140684 RepID=UPI003134F850|nr:hypothetical protein [Anaerolineales bacterium]